MHYNEEYSSAGEHPDYSGGATWFNSTLFFFFRKLFKGGYYAN